MKQNYENCLQRLLKDEGGYSNHPSDPGGPTNFGITIYDYRLYIDPDGTAEDVKNMSVDQAKKIYKNKYWNKLECDSLPSGVDYSVFDYGVNSGVGRSARILQQLVHVSVDGDIGPKTLAAVEAADPVKLIRSINTERMNFLQGLKTWKTFGKGWSKRINGVLEYSLILAKAEAKAEKPEIKPSFFNWLINVFKN